MWWKTMFLSKTFLSLHWSHRHVTCSFDNHIEVFLVQGQNFFAECPKKIEGIHFFRESIFFRKVPTKIQETVLTKLPNFFKKNWIVFVRSTDMFRKLNVFQEEIFRFRMFFWTRRTKICQTYRNSFGRRSTTGESYKSFRFKFDCVKKTKFLSKNSFLYTGPTDTWIVVLLASLLFSWNKAKNSSLKVRKDKRTQNLFQKSVFSSKCFFWNI